MATLVGAVVRVPYTFAVALFGGRNWTIVCARRCCSCPTVAAFVVMEPGTSYTTFLLVAMLAGVGGGNFASSMTNINAFFPLRKKGWALGLNAGGGNIGVPGRAARRPRRHRRRPADPRVLLGIYIPLHRRRRRPRRALHGQPRAREERHRRRQGRRAGTPHTWIMSFLYIGTFGSFIGYSFAFGLVLQTQFGRTPAAGRVRSPSSARCSAR